RFTAHQGVHYFLCAVDDVFLERRFGNLGKCRITSMSRTWVRPGGAGVSCAFAAFLVAQTLTQAAENSPVLPDSEIRKILMDRIDTYRQSVGIVVGVIEPKGRRIVAYGSLDQGDSDC